MTEIERKALALVNEVAQDVRYEPDDFEEERRDVFKALRRAIEQHEAYKQEVSDAVEKLSAAMLSPYVDELLARFILPKPVDPLVEAVEAVGERLGTATWKEYAAELRAEGQVRGYEWRKIGEGGDAA